VPAEWVSASTHPWSNTDSGGYGYLWWPGDSATPGSPDYVFPLGSFWLEGHLGQYAVVIPSRDLIVVGRVASEHPRQEMHKREMAKPTRMVMAASGAPVKAAEDVLNSESKQTYRPHEIKPNVVDFEMQISHHFNADLQISIRNR